MSSSLQHILMHLTFYVPQTDLAPHVGASLDVMKRDAAIMREGGPTIFAAVRHGDGVEEIKESILGAWRASGAAGKGKPLSAFGKGKSKAE
jgi:urease accessory protein